MPNNKWFLKKRQALVSRTRRTFFPQLARSKVRAIVVTIPKSGTHLITRSLDLFPGFFYDGRHLRNFWDQKKIEEFLQQVQPGFFVRGHLHFSEERLGILKQLEYKIILLIRDPRDIAVSQLHAVLSKETHFLRDYYMNLPDDNARLRAGILGASSPLIHNDGHNVADIVSRLNKFLLWSQHNCCVIRFEDLVGSRGGGEDATQIQTIQKIADHLGFPLSGSDVDRIIKNSYSTKSETFRKGIIGDWVNHFTDEHKETFKQLAGQMLIELGYETGTAW